jgi:hypothetical protein
VQAGKATWRDCTENVNETQDEPFHARAVKLCRLRDEFCRCRPHNPCFLVVRAQSSDRTADELFTQLVAATTKSGDRIARRRWAALPCKFAL